MRRCEGLDSQAESHLKLSARFWRVSATFDEFAWGWRARQRSRITLSGASMTLPPPVARTRLYSPQIQGSTSPC